MAMSFDEALAGLHSNHGGSQIYDMDDYIKIDNKRNFIIPDGYNTVLAYSGDTNSQIVSFEYPISTDDHDLSLCSYKKLKWKNLTSGFEGSSTLIEEVDHGFPGATIGLLWNVPTEALTQAGQLEISLSFYDIKEGRLAYAWNTPPCKAFSVGEGFIDVAPDLDDLNLPAKNEILFVGMNKKILAPNGFNGTIAAYGDTGISKLYFQAKREINGIDLLAPDSKIQVLVKFNGQTSTDEITTIKESFIITNEFDLVTLVWNLPGWLTNSTEFYYGPITIGLVFEQGNKVWSTFPFSDLLIGQSLIDSDYHELQERPDLLGRIEAAEEVASLFDTEEKTFEIGENVSANGEQSVAEGYETNAGMRGFKLDPALISEDGKTFTIVEGTLEGVTVEDYAYISLLDEPTGGWRPGIQAYGITNISDDLKSITLSSVVVDTAGNPLTKGQTTTASGKTIDTESRLAWMLYFRDKPHLGTVGVSSRAHAEGRNTKATGDSSHAEGRETKTFGDYTHAEGRKTLATAEGAHAEGWETESRGDFAHTEGRKSKATSSYSHAEGENSSATAQASHAEGKGTIASGEYSHAEGESSKASGIRAHAEGEGSEAQASGSHAEGGVTKVLSNAAYGHSEGLFTEVSGTNGAHAEGHESKAVGETSHSEGKSTRSYGVYSHAEGEGTVAGVEGKAGDTGKAAHAEGRNTVASGAISHAEGDKSKATNYGSHAEGIKTTASGSGSHSEGASTIASGDYSHAEGNASQATSFYSHAEGYNTVASGTKGSHAEGLNTVASGENSHAEGRNTIASGPISHAEGDQTTAKGTWSHSEGLGTIASGNHQHVQGKYNLQDKTLAHIVGAGTSDTDRKNIHTLDWNGNAWFAGDVRIEGRGGLSEAYDKIQAMQKQIRLLELANQGNTYAFETDNTTAFLKHIPNNALPNTVIEKVEGRMLAYAETQSPDYAPVQLESITIRGKNLVPPTVYDMSNWTRDTTGVGGYKLNLPDGWYCLSLKLKEGYPSNIYYYLQMSTDGGLTYTAQKAGYGGTGYASDGYCVTNNGILQVPVWFKVDNANGQVFKFTCHDITQDKLDWIYDIQIEAVEMVQEPSTSYPPKTYAPPTEYTPYIEPITYTIPDAVKNLPDYGYGISNSVCNYIDFEKKQYVQMCYMRAYESGDENRTDVKPNMSYTAICAPLDEPIVTDISKHLAFDNTFEVQGGGFIEFGFKSVGEWFGESIEYNEAAPSTITYQVKL